MEIKQRADNLRNFYDFEIKWIFVLGVEKEGFVIQSSKAYGKGSGSVLNDRPRGIFWLEKVWPIREFSFC